MTTAWTMVLAIGISLTAQETGTRLNSRVAYVGDDMITQVDLDRRILIEMHNSDMRLSQEEFKRRKPEYSRAVLELMINDRLILQEAWRKVGGKKKASKGQEKGRDPRTGAPRAPRGYVTEEQIDHEIERRIRELRKVESGIHNKRDYYRYAKQTVGVSRKELRDRVRDELVIRRYLQQGYFSSIDPFVPPRQSRYYYRTHLEEFSKPIRLSFRRIFLVPDRRLTPILMKQIEDGFREGREKGRPDEEVFIELARDYSQDYPTPEDRGKVWEKSYRDLQHMARPLQEQLSIMKVGDVSGPTPSKKGIHYIYLVDRVEGEPRSYDEAQKEIERKIILKRRERSYQRLIRNLRAKTDVKIFIPGDRYPIDEGPADEKKVVKEAAGPRLSGRPKPETKGSPETKELKTGSGN